jgi:GTPase SAR1 family protein
MLTKHLDFNIIFIGQEKTGTFYYIIDLYSKMQMDESTKLCDIKYKIVFLGDSAVGKSALIERFIKERFDDNKVVSPSLFRKLLELISW